MCSEYEFVSFSVKAPSDVMQGERDVKSQQQSKINTYARCTSSAHNDFAF